MCITTNIQLIAITDAMTTSSISTTTAGTTTMMLLNVAGTLLECVACTLLIVEVVKCVLDIERCVPISDTLLTGGVTVDDCDDGMSAEYVDTVEQFMGITVTSSSEPQHLSCSLVQIVQGLVLVNVIAMSDGVNVSFTPTVHLLIFPAIMVSLSI